jgi:predicted PurR-regulated permease PerM
MVGSEERRAKGGGRGSRVPSREIQAKAEGMRQKAKGRKQAAAGSQQHGMPEAAAGRKASPQQLVNRVTLLLLVCVVSAVFLTMIRHFLMPILLAGIFAALAQPLYLYLARRFGGRRQMASLVTLLLIVFVVLLPFGFLAGIITAQALKLGESVRPWVQQKLAEPDTLSALFVNLPFYEQIAPYRATILQKAGELVGSMSSYLINSLSSMTVMTVNFLFATVILLYSMFFFLIDGQKLMNKILYYLPLEDHNERLLLEKFTSVTRATLKGTLVVGLVQGGLAGLAFQVVGIPSSLFWGTVMAVLSIIPGIGSALIWGPAALILISGGHYAAGIGLAVFCTLVVGSVDNFLRPMLVGKDTRMHELMIFFSTLGGLALFGFIGIIVGPVIAALFITLWEMYGEAFREVLPHVGMFQHEPGGSGEDGAAIAEAEGGAAPEEVPAAPVPGERRDG